MKTAHQTEIFTWSEFFRVSILCFLCKCVHWQITYINCNLTRVEALNGLHDNIHEMVLTCNSVKSSTYQRQQTMVCLNRWDIAFFVGMILKPWWYDRLSLMGFHYSLQPPILFNEDLLNNLCQSIDSSLKSENLRMKRFLKMINLWNDATRRWYWRKIIAILLVDGMDCQIITWNVCHGQLHNSLANPMIVREDAVLDLAFLSMLSLAIIVNTFFFRLLGVKTPFMWYW